METQTGPDQTWVVQYVPLVEPHPGVGRVQLGPAAFITQQASANRRQAIPWTDGVPALASAIGIDRARRLGHDQLPTWLDYSGPIECATVYHLTPLIGLVQQLPFVAIGIEPFGDPDEVVARLDGVDDGACRNVGGSVRTRPGIGATCWLRVRLR